ncbi:hypothetical protein LOTGIDRAFT_153652 [Lottia gigantea]|uniref:Uncharacterized protein n=1 Tax=Lottia gigantea TaxID=225164 RepID=V4A3C0_LOTGI|nr:hypothetical protein LOTGIDRAFT_153652 [Lottia gigantea]ESO91222.1 hypothetical protein LOTGIDRAFT_153652 [Lottia gigantea]
MVIVVPDTLTIGGFIVYGFLFHVLTRFNDKIASHPGWINEWAIRNPMQSVGSLTLRFKICKKSKTHELVSRFTSKLIPGVRGDCPHDVTAQAYGCFTSYSSHLQNMQASRRQLCCGVDVETLRAFCSSIDRLLDSID